MMRGTMQAAMKNFELANSNNPRVKQKVAQLQRKAASKKRRNDAIEMGEQNRKKKKFGVQASRRPGKGDQRTPGRGSY